MRTVLQIFCLRANPWICCPNTRVRCHLTTDEQYDIDHSRAVDKIPWATRKKRGVLQLTPFCVLWIGRRVWASELWIISDSKLIITETIREKVRITDDYNHILLDCGMLMSTCFVFSSCLMGMGWDECGLEWKGGGGGDNNEMVSMCAELEARPLSVTSAMMLWLALDGAFEVDGDCDKRVLNRLITSIAAIATNGDCSGECKNLLNVSRSAMTACNINGEHGDNRASFLSKSRKIAASWGLAPDITALMARSNDDIIPTNRLNVF